MSTPFGERGFLYDELDANRRGVAAVRVPATECARISAGFLEAERATMGDRRFRQEYLCEFVETVSGVFDRDLVEGAMSCDFEPLRIP